MHRLILGTVGSGKTTYARWTCSALHKAGVSTIVFNPYEQIGWECGQEYSTPEETLEACQKDEEKYLFLEEASSLRRDPKWDVFTTWLRNTKTHTFVIAQQLKMVTPNLRKQCEEVILFRCSLSDCREIADEYREPALFRIEKFDDLQFFVVSHKHPLRTSKLDFKTKAWPKLQNFT